VLLKVIETNLQNSYLRFGSDSITDSVLDAENAVFSYPLAGRNF
jgi:hypothetical protein